jgi:hypothetical protein
MLVNISVATRSPGAILLALSSPVFGQADGVPQAAVRLDPVAAIIDALETHQIVALGDWHYNLELHELRLALVRDPRFPGVVNNIVVEFGTPKHQNVIDAYVNGTDVPYEELRRVWTETSQGSLWDGRVYEEFFEGVRDVNSSQPENRRIRVVLGDPTPLTMEAEAALIKREVIDKEHNALIVFGYMHLPRKPLWYTISDQDWMEFAYNHPETVSTVEHLEAAGISVFSIYPRATDPFVAVQADTISWEEPALAILEGTVLGSEPFATFASTRALMTVPDTDGDGFHQESAIPDPARSGLTEEQFDAVLLLGPLDTLRTGEPYSSEEQD